MPGLASTEYMLLVQVFHWAHLRMKPKVRNSVEHQPKSLVCICAMVVRLSRLFWEWDGPPTLKIGILIINGYIIYKPLLLGWWPSHIWNFLFAHILIFVWSELFLFFTECQDSNCHVQTKHPCLQIQTAGSHESKEYHNRWWLNQPIWNILQSNWIISPGIGLKKEHIFETTTVLTGFFLWIEPKSRSTQIPDPRIQNRDPRIPSIANDRRFLQQRPLKPFSPGRNDTG